MSRRLVAVFILLLAMLTPAAAQTMDPLARYYAQKLQWRTCTKHLQCATFKVPLDYRDPGGRAITITAARNRATGTAKGSLVLNPGGPGGSGIEYIEEAAYIVSPVIHRQFNLVSFDPRGLGRSTPLRCLNDRQTDAFMEVDQTPDTPAEEQKLAASARELVAACRRSDAALMAHVSTAEVARDMDILRALLGESRLRYLGKSWGTALGQAYAAFFPSKTGLFVLDGAVDIRLSLAQGSLDQARGFELAADRFLDWCTEQGKCVLGKTKEAARARLVAFLRGLDAKPLRTQTPKRPLTEQQAWTALIGPLYVAIGGREWLYAALALAITQNDGTELQKINDWFIERNTRGVYANNGNTLIYAVNCLDRTGSGTLQDAKSKSLVWTRQFPVMGRLMAWGDVACAGWPYAAQEPLDRLRISNVPPMLIVGTTYDPATPLLWSQSVQRRIPKSVLIVNVGDGHTGYAVDSRCIDAAVNAYLLSRDPNSPALPKNGTRCD